MREDTHKHAKTHLVRDIPRDLVLGGLEDVVQRHRQLDHPEGGTQVAPRFRDRLSWTWPRADVGRHVRCARGGGCTAELAIRTTVAPTMHMAMHRYGTPCNMFVGVGVCCRDGFWRDGRGYKNDTACVPACWSVVLSKLGREALITLLD